MHVWVMPLWGQAPLIPCYLVVTDKTYTSYNSTSGSSQRRQPHSNSFIAS